MWTIKKQWASDFMSFELMEYDYTKGCAVVQAENRTDPGQVSNGGGKSSFIDIVPITLLGQSITGRNLKDCINWASDKKFFIVGVSLDHTDGRKCEITRKVYNNTKAQELEILVDGVTPKTIPTKANVEGAVDVKEGNRYILDEILCLAKEDLLSYYLIASGYYTPYMKMSANKRTEVISKISRVDLIDKAIYQVEVGNTFAADRERTEILIGGIQATISHQQLVLQEKQENLPKGDTLEYHQDAISDARDLLQEVLDRVIDTTALEELRELRVEVYKELVKLEADKRSNDQLVATLEKYLIGVIKCPECQHEFLPNDDQNVDQVRDDLVFATSEFQISEDAFASQKITLAEIDDLGIATKAERALLEEQKRADVQAIRSEILALETDLKKQELAQQELDQMVDTIRLNQEKIAGYEAKIIEFLKGEELSSEWIKTLNDFKFHMANKPVKAIAGHINYYLEQNKSDLRVEIEGFKKLKSGQIRQQLTPRIFRMGEERDYASFSGGERARIDLSCDLAFQEIMNASSPSGGLNYYQNDELLNPVDVEGIANAARAFDELDKTILLVSHSGSELSYEKVVMLHKENGITKCLTKD